ncbi:hypothetical protein Ahy_B09g097126 isoform E [Arachis hypogaea]|uniref:Uncharacterized protein n=1 Tax=Arachis hypogaea TaxID=3818 RepID=A0A444XNE1_ARAHY|nr:hypothetical protein Ahy_B09g097126 isoform E [Arachis hypogaea]
MDMLVLIGCVMEGKEVDYPQLIRQSMWRTHIRGLLPFPTLVTSMIELADVPWEDDDVTPPPPNDDSPASDEQDQEEEHIEERLSRRHPQRHRPPQRFSSLLRTHNQYHTTATVRCDC